jgi:phospholipase/carboxylesterase
MKTTESATGTAKSGGVLESVEITTGEQPTAAVVWLHGLGADGHDFEPIVPWLRWPGAPSVRYVFPHAPVRPVTVNGGMQMRAWYDIRGFQIDRDQDEDAILESMDQATALVRREQERGIAAERILVAGFSQGGAIAIQCALRYPERLAGLIALSTYMLRADHLQSERHAANHGLPVFQGHGRSDPIVPLRLGQDASARLQALGHPVDWHEYPMQHAVCPEEIQHIAAWMGARF